jgi:hypothetical protein
MYCGKKLPRASGTFASKNFITQCTDKRTNDEQQEDPIPIQAIPIKLL